MATFGFPVRQPDVTVQKLAQSPLFNTARSTGSTAATRPVASGGLNMVVNIEPGKKYYLQGVQVFCDRPYYVGVTVRKAAALTFNNLQEATFFTLGTQDQQTFIPYNELLFEGGQVQVSATPLTATTETAALSMKLVGRAQSLFETDNSDATIAVIGDSKMLYTLETGSFGERYYTNQLVKNLQGFGKKINVVDKTMPGSSSADGVKLIKSGALDGFSYDMLVIGFGTNNSATTATAPVLAQFKADLTEIIQHRNRNNPGATIILMTPGVTDKTSLVANIGAYRTAVAELAADTTLGKNIFVVQEHLAFTPSTTVKSDRFVSTETLNNQLHYSMLGHDEVYNNVFLPVVKTTPFYQLLTS